MGPYQRPLVTETSFHPFRSETILDEKAMSREGSIIIDLPRAIPRRRGAGAMAEKDSSEESSDYFNAASSDEETDFDLDTKFPFYSSSIPILTADSVNCFVDEKLEEAELPSEPRTTSFQPGPSFEIYKVEYSRYLDDEYGTDEVRAELGHSPNSTTATKRDGALFRWIHLKQDPMDFGAFQNAARSLPDLTEEEADEIMFQFQFGTVKIL